MCNTPIHLPEREPPCDVKQFNVNSIQFNSINCKQQPIASQVHLWWPTMNIGKTQYRASSFMPNPCGSKEYKQENTMLAWFELRLLPGPLPGAYSNSAAQANRGSIEASRADCTCKCKQWQKQRQLPMVRLLRVVADAQIPMLL